jgi:hypothetical protein
MSEERLAQLSVAAHSPFPFDHPATQIVADAVAELVAEVKRLRTQLAEAATLLGHFVDHEDEPCRFDHHGACQEHGGSSLRRCDVAAGRELLARTRGGGDNGWR